MCSCMVDALRLSLRRPPAPSSPTRGLLRRWRRAGVVFVRLCPRATPPLRWLSSSRGLPLDGLPILELAPARAAPHLLVLLSRHHALGEVRPLRKSDSRAVRFHHRPVEIGRVSCHIARSCAHMMGGRAGRGAHVRTHSSEAYTATSQSIGARDRSSARLSGRASASGQKEEKQRWTDGRADGQRPAHARTVSGENPASRCCPQSSRYLPRRGLADPPGGARCSPPPLR